MLKINNINKAYGKKLVINNLNLELKPKSIFGLIGVNGAGKSTLLRLIAGSLITDSGIITFDNQVILDNENIKKGLFFLPDDPAYNAHTTGNSLVKFYSVFYELDQDLLNELIKTFNIEMDKPIHTFSKGMRRQLYIAIAIATKPKLLLLDEAFDGLDPKARLIFKRALISLSEENDTIVIIASHSLRELEDICDNFGILNGGNFKTSGNISDTLETVNKYQLAFDELKESEDFKLLKPLNVEITGRVVQLIIKGHSDDVIKVLETYKPLFIEVIPVDLEELFVYEVEDQSYEELS